MPPRRRNTLSRLENYLRRSGPIRPRYTVQTYLNSLFNDNPLRGPAPPRSRVTLRAALRDARRAGPGTIPRRVMISRLRREMPIRMRALQRRLS